MTDDKMLLLVLDELLRPLSTADAPLESCRARGEFLGLSHSQVHRIQRGLVPLSAKMARKIVSRVGRTQAERDRADAELRPFVNASVDGPARRIRMCLEALRLQGQAVLKIDFSHPPFDTML